MDCASEFKHTFAYAGICSSHNMAPFNQVFKESFGINLFSRLYSVETNSPARLVNKNIKSKLYNPRARGMTILIDLHKQEVTAMTFPSLLVSITSSTDFVEAGEIISTFNVYPGTR